MDESSGNRADSHGSYTLTDATTTGSATGKINLAASFDGSTNELTNSSTDLSLATYGSFTMQFWVYVAVDQTSGIIRRYSGTAVNAEFNLYWQNSSRKFQFRVYDNVPSSFSYAFAETPTGLALNTWHHVLVWYDSTTLKCYIRLNNGTVYESSALSVGARGGGTAPTSIGLSTFGGSFLNGRIDEVGLWKRLLDGTEQTNLYNGGNGIPYPLIPAVNVTVPASRTTSFVRSRSQPVSTGSTVLARRTTSFAWSRPQVVYLGDSITIAHSRTLINNPTRSQRISTGSTVRASRTTSLALSRPQSVSIGVSVPASRTTSFVAVRPQKVLLSVDAIARRATTFLIARSQTVQIRQEVFLNQSRTVLFNAIPRPQALSLGATIKASRSPAFAFSRSPFIKLGDDVAVSSSRTTSFLISRSPVVSAGVTVPASRTIILQTARQAATSISVTVRPAPSVSLAIPRTPTVNAVQNVLIRTRATILNAPGASIVSAGVTINPRRNLANLTAREQKALTGAGLPGERTLSLVISRSPAVDTQTNVGQGAAVSFLISRRQVVPNETVLQRRTVLWSLPVSPAIRGMAVPGPYDLAAGKVFQPGAQVAGIEFDQSEEIQ